MNNYNGKSIRQGRIENSSKLNNCINQTIENTNKINDNKFSQPIASGKK